MGNESNKNKIEDNIKIDELNKLNQIKIKKISLNLNEPPPKVVVGIDFGTSGIGYAYSFYNNQNNIILSNLNDESSGKVPTQIILDKNLKNILSFGNECSRYIEAHHKEKKNYEYFKNIKMNLYKKIYKIRSTNGNEANIEDIITKILKYISNKAISQIQNCNDSTIKEEDIKWVVTIPAIWEEKSKQIMVNASLKAGLINENTDLSLFLALEPEVAGMYYSSNISSYKNINIEKPYIICDIGAGTADICTYRKIINKSNSIDSQLNKSYIFDSELIEEYPPIGGDYGGNIINEEFIKRLIIELFGEKRINQLQNDPNNEDWNEFEEKIEKLKKIINYDDYKLDCNIFEDENINKQLDDYISEYNNKNHQYKIEKIRKWELSIPNQIFLDITKEVAKKIFSKIEEIYNNVHTGNIICTGAGSKNTKIIQYFNDFASEKNMNINIELTSEPQVAIVKGAVLFGYNNNVIRKRKSKFTIGIKASKNWEEKYEGKGKRKENEIEGDQCSNLFSKFITRNNIMLLHLNLNLCFIKP